MTYWRKLFLVLLLALSLPVQSFAALSMNCGLSHMESNETFAQHGEVAEAPHMHHMHGVLMADSANHDHSHHDSIDHKHSCAACASCCIGVAPPATPSVMPSADALSISIQFPRAVGVASFLTGGIERPPRPTLV
jgi:hypothetical protein